MTKLFEMTETKPASSSLTIRAAIVSLIASVLPVFGLQIAPDVLPNLEQIIAGIAAAIAVYGRLRARTIIEQI